MLAIHWFATPLCCATNWGQLASPNRLVITAATTSHSAAAAAHARQRRPSTRNKNKTPGYTFSVHAAPTAIPPRTSHPRRRQYHAKKYANAIGSDSCPM